MPCVSSLFLACVFFFFFFSGFLVVWFCSFLLGVCKKQFFATIPRVEMISFWDGWDFGHGKQQGPRVLEMKPRNLPGQNMSKLG